MHENYTSYTNPQEWCQLLYFVSLNDIMRAIRKHFEMTIEMSFEMALGMTLEMSALKFNLKNIKLLTKLSKKVLEKWQKSYEQVTKESRKSYEQVTTCVLHRANFPSSKFRENKNINKVKYW